MRIVEIQKLKNSRYKLILNNRQKVITYDDVILKNKLLFPKELSIEDLRQLNLDTKFYDIYNELVKKISIRLRSEFEIATILSKRGIVKEEQSQFIEPLKQVGLLNDRLFAKAYFFDRFYLSRVGPYKIQEELREHHIEESFIQDVMEQVSEEEVAFKLQKYLLKKVKQNHKYSKYMLQQKLMMEGMKLGYSRDMISSLLVDLPYENADILGLEFEKCYRRLQGKFSGDELILKIRQKLYQKGFGLEEIAQIIEEKIAGE